MVVVLGEAHLVLAPLHRVGYMVLQMAISPVQMLSGVQRYLVVLDSL